MELQVMLPGLQKEVTVRSMKVKEMDILSNKQAMASGDGIDKLLQDCLLTEGIQVNGTNLLSCDRNAIMIGVRRATFGNELEFEFKCPDCEEKHLYEIDLSTLPLIPGNREMIAERLSDEKKLFPFKLPSGRNIHFRFSDGLDQKQGIRIQKTKSDELATAYLFLRIKQIDKIDGEEVVPNVKEFIKNMELSDVEAFREYYEEVCPGIDDEIKIECQNAICGSEHTLTIPMDDKTFFKRSSRKGKPCSTVDII